MPKIDDRFRDADEVFFAWEQRVITRDLTKEAVIHDVAEAAAGMREEFDAVMPVPHNCLVHIHGFELLGGLAYSETVDLTTQQGLVEDVHLVLVGMPRIYMGEDDRIRAFAMRGDITVGRGESYLVADTHEVRELAFGEIHEAVTAMEAEYRALRRGRGSDLGAKDVDRVEGDPAPAASKPKRSKRQAAGARRRH